MDIILEALTNLRNYIQLASIMDIFDVLVVAFLIYKLIVLIRNTAASQALKGIVLILVLLVFSSFAKMNVLNFLLTTTMQIGSIAVVIVFQPELRKMLSQVGSSRFPKLSSLLGSRGETDQTHMETVIAQTVHACNEMSLQRIGALIVFERKVFLDDIAKSGTILDSEVSSMLLRNIFFPNAALHDGATIIRNGRILACGCMLPLTSNNNLSPDLGMRHRAGVGASEHSDAVVVIVSEETGSISVAVGGMLKRHLNTETLSILLKNELSAEEEGERKKSVLSIFQNRRSARNANKSDGKSKDK